MAVITVQGEASTTGTILWKCPKNKTAKFELITCTNTTGSYEIILSRFNNSTGSLVTIYKFTLDNGDFFSDSNNYFLKSDDQLILTSSILGTSYTAQFAYEDAIN